jgi:hypothetical protein
MKERVQMSREVRRVPADWQHPKRSNGRYVPLLGGSYSAEVARWDHEAEQWEKGFRLDWSTDNEFIPKTADHRGTYAEWSGPRPVESEYMPDWTDAERTHFQMYQTTSEGTPISPVMESPEELARWLVDNKASAFADIPATYEQWLATIKAGWAPSAAVVSDAGLVSGVSVMRPPS